MALDGSRTLPGTREVGQPLKYETAQDLQEWVDMYFDECKVNRQTAKLLETATKPEKVEELLKKQDAGFTDDCHPTITGMAYYLDLTRQTVINYEGKEEYKDVVKRAKLRVELYNEQKLHSPNNNGVQFILTNGFNWKHKQEVDNNVGFKVTIGDKDSGNL